MIKVLSCTPNEELGQLRATILALRGCNVVCAKAEDEALHEMRSGKFDVLLLCHRVGIETAHRLCSEFRRLFPTGRIIATQNLGTNDNHFNADYVVDANQPETMLRAVIGMPYLVRRA